MEKDEILHFAAVEVGLHALPRVLVLSFLVPHIIASASPQDQVELAPVARAMLPWDLVADLHRLLGERLAERDKPGTQH
jgi:hypothetical protein